MTTPVTCPVIYDNDDHDDMYTDEYLLSLAGAGNITRCRSGSPVSTAREPAVVGRPASAYFFPEYFFSSNSSFLRVAGRIAFGCVMSAVARA